MTLKQLTLSTIAIAAIAGGSVLFAPGSARADNHSAAESASTTAEASEAPSAAEAAPKAEGIMEMTLGAEDAPVTVMEYASFTCPHCAAFHKSQVKQLKAEYVETGKVRYVYRDVYFDRIGLWASMLARCESDRFFGMVDLIYGKQDEWLKSRDPVVLADNLRKLGKVAGLSEERIDACMQDADKARALVDWFEANMKVDKIEGTPSVFVDGKPLGSASYKDIKAAIDAKLGG